jgi:hypothetical protein
LNRGCNYLGWLVRALVTAGFKTLHVAGLKRWRQIRKQRKSKPMSNYGDSFSLSYTVRTKAGA